MASQAGGTTVTANRQQRAHIQTLARQGSLYTLTLNEVESHLGEPLLSMSLENLVRSVLPDDLSLPLPNGVGDSGSQSTSAPAITMPPALSKKTVGAVWRDVQHERGSSHDEGSSGCDTQLTLGEMTLEDFLRRAGIVARQYQKDADELQDFPQGAGAIDAYIINQSMAHPLRIAIPATMDAIYPDGQMGFSSSVALSDLQTLSHKQMSSEDMVCKVADRRQKRMIKNRESAARSRARKQAYTNELENKLSGLEEENKKLKKEKKLDKLFKSARPPEPKNHLRRTRSTSF